MIPREEMSSQHMIYTTMGCLCCGMLWMPKKMFPQANSVHGTFALAGEAKVPWTRLAYGKKIPHLEQIQSYMQITHCELISSCKIM
jgi:hypothetical protein